MPQTFVIGLDKIVLCKRPYIPGQVLQVVPKDNQRAKATYFVFRPDYKNNITSPKGTVPLVEA